MVHLQVSLNVMCWLWQVEGALTFYPGWLSKNLMQRLLSEVEISALPWYNIEKKSEGLGK